MVYTGELTDNRKRSASRYPHLRKLRLAHVCHMSQSTLSHIPVNFGEECMRYVGELTVRNRSVSRVLFNK